ncbi:hypothetical protein [Streptomyces albidocamelliae]|uniref:Uncharacterized protein n=1 Tax=Streptomyces albidocamelliae TaxID=2981135 RepID=A0ABY6F016_9ACTN|nr:hypothetical protein [Streptomyces sp. HUAS 14-6]UXY39938.1 hypothetical protein N8I86_37655 [Streptomyces sp. HUAS 14-6]
MIPRRIAPLFSLLLADDDRLGGLKADLVRAFAADFVLSYQHLEDSQQWFGQIRGVATKHGFAATPKEYKKYRDTHPEIARRSQLKWMSLRSIETMT